jgi:basic membrane protein A
MLHGIRSSLSWLLPAALVLGAGCGTKLAKAPSEEAREEPVRAEAPSFVAAFLYQGAKNDDGFNQAQSAGAAAVAQQLGVKLIEQENVPDGPGAVAAMEKLVTAENARVLFATGFGQFDAAMEVARKHPATSVLHCGGFYEEGRSPTNAGSFNAYLDEAFYVSGVVAGMTSKSSRLGFVAGTMSPHVLRNINAFTLGVRSVNATATVETIFTGVWSDADREVKAANQLIAKHVDVLAMYVGSPVALLEHAEKKGVHVVGVHVNGAKHAPRMYLTGAEEDWTKIYTDYVTSLRLEKKFPRIVRGGLMEGYVRLSPFGPGVSKEAQAKAGEARAKIATGKLVIFKGPLYDNQGKLVLPPARQLIQRDLTLEKTTYLVEGVIGKLPG